MCLPAALPCPIDEIFLFVGCVFALSVESAFLRIWEPAFLPPDSPKNVFSGLDNVGFGVFSPWKFRFWVPIVKFYFPLNGENRFISVIGKNNIPKSYCVNKSEELGIWEDEAP